MVGQMCSATNPRRNSARMRCPVDAGVGIGARRTPYPFAPNKANFLRFSAENGGGAEKQSQFKPENGDWPAACRACLERGRRIPRSGLYLPPVSVANGGLACKQMCKAKPISWGTRMTISGSTGDTCAITARYRRRIGKANFIRRSTAFSATAGRTERLGLDAAGRANRVDGVCNQAISPTNGRRQPCR